MIEIIAGLIVGIAIAKLVQWRVCSWRRSMEARDKWLYSYFLLAEELVKDSDFPEESLKRLEIMNELLINKKLPVILSQAMDVLENERTAWLGQTGLSVPDVLQDRWGSLLVSWFAAIFSLHGRSSREVLRRIADFVNPDPVARSRAIRTLEAQIDHQAERDFAHAA